MTAINEDIINAEMEEETTTSTSPARSRLCPVRLLEQSRQLLLELAREGRFDEDRADAQTAAEALHAVLYERSSDLPTRAVVGADSDHQ